VEYRLGIPQGNHVRSDGGRRDRLAQNRERFERSTRGAVGGSLHVFGFGKVVGSFPARHLRRLDLANECLTLFCEDRRRVHKACAFRPGFLDPFRQGGDLGGCAFPAGAPIGLLIRDHGESTRRKFGFACQALCFAPKLGKRHALFLQANKILETEQPYTGLYNPTDLWLVKPNVAGLEHEGVLDQFHIGEASFK